MKIPLQLQHSIGLLSVAGMFLPPCLLRLQEQQAWLVPKALWSLQLKQGTLRKDREEENMEGQRVFQGNFHIFLSSI